MGTNKKEAYVILELTHNCKLKEVEKSYKRLALEWFPQKHSYSALANEKFKQISHAYCTLMATEKKKDEMNMSEMIALFQKVFFKDSTPFAAKGAEDNFNDYYDSEDDDDDEDEDYDDLDDDDLDFSDDDLDHNHHGLDCNCGHVLFTNSLKEALPKVTLKDKEAKAVQNAMELVAEEEKEKRKAEKRRAKKKRRKLKKKQEKDEAQKKNETEGTVDEARAQASNSSGSEEEGLDPSSAFVAVVANKKMNNSAQSQASNRKRNNLLRRTSNNDAQADNTNLQNIDPIVLQSRQLAIRGNQMASMDEYQAAISFFTAAIKLDPQDFRYFGNRSYCYERTEQFDRAFRDADRAILLAPNWPKGHFRKGRALFGLQRYAEAEECFQEVTKLDKNCTEAFTELLASRTAGIMEMGFPKHLAENAATKYANLQAAVNALVAESANSHQLKAAAAFGAGGANNGWPTAEIEGGDVYQSDEEFPTEEEYNNQQQQQQHSISTPKNVNAFGSKDDKMDPKNTHNQSSLWVGNLKKEATEKSVSNLFGKYGELVSVRILPDSRCAFINYKTSRAASRAMENLQGFEYFGENLLIRFPDHQHTLGQASVTVLKKKIPTAKTKSKESFEFKGPVNGDECYFWRMSGCIHGAACRYRHVPKHKGIDLK